MANATAALQPGLLPRILRVGGAPGYLGMCKEEFKNMVRPYVREFPIGKQGVGFDRLELDAWMDAYIEAMAVGKASNQDNNRPRSERRGGSTWRKNEPRASTRGTGSGISTRSSEERDFKKALAQAKGTKQSST